MPLDNTLNVSELLRRLGVKGDSQGSVALLEALRLNLIIGDLSDLVPPVGIPFGSASISSTSAVGTFNQWSLASRAPGGLTVRTLRSDGGTFRLWITPTALFGAAALSDAHNFSFGQQVQSIFSRFVAGAQQGPPRTLVLSGQPSLGVEFDNWVGPGEFFNIEAEVANLAQKIIITWKEYPAALNPG